MNKLQSTNPGKGYELVGEVEVTSLGGVKTAVVSAKEALKSWSQISLEERIFYFEKLVDVYTKRANEVAEIQTKEMGKPISQSRVDVEGDIARLKYLIKVAPQYLKPEIVDESETQVNTVFFEPYGVIAAIAPWNYPTSNFFITVTQALLAGNTIVFKHSEECPLSSEILDEMFKEAGFPEGVFSTIYGDGEVGKMLVDQDINMIHFTGSTKVGEYLYKIAAEKFIPAILEMGGSSPGIIFADADLEKAVPSACEERFKNCGQICCALKRLVVHKDVYDEVIKKAVEHVKGLVVGDPMNENTFIGPLVAERQLILLEEQVKDAVDKGAQVLIGGKRPEGLNGAYYEPTLLANVTEDMRVFSEEVFGPVLSIVQFETEGEAIEMANNTIFGLSAFVYTEDPEKASRVTRLLEAGNVSINGASYFSKNSPFGGYKKSGMGSNDGKFGFRQVTRMKTVAKMKKG